MTWRSFALAALPILLAGLAHAQDLFEIHVLEYEQLRPREFTWEDHTNYAGSGLLHVTHELTGGITDHISFGVMQLNARRPGTPLESAGFRLVPHLYAPRSWRWPIDVGLVAEFSFNDTAWFPDSRSVELVPIIEKRFGRFQIDLNPAVGRSHRTWDSGLAARLAFAATRRFTPSLEYYGDRSQQAHQIFPGADFRLRKNIVWNLGVGVGLTPFTDRIVYKSRFEISFGGRRNP
jgi:hypothetical protein